MCQGTGSTIIELKIGRPVKSVYLYTIACVQLIPSARHSASAAAAADAKDE